MAGALSDYGHRRHLQGHTIDGAGRQVVVFLEEKRRRKKDGRGPNEKVNGRSEG